MTERPTIIDFVEKYSRKFENEVYLREKVDGAWKEITQGQTREEAYRIGAGLMSTRDFENYSDLFDLMMSLVNPPDLLIYLRSSIPNLIAQIQKRGREYERSIRIDYITGLNQRYEDWIKDYKSRLLIVDVDNIKFENRPEDFQVITDKIDAELFGLFPAE